MDYLTTEQAAARLGKTPKAFATFRERRRAMGQPIPEHRLAGERRCYYRAADLDALFEKVEAPSIHRARPRAFLASHRRAS